MSFRSSMHGLLLAAVCWLAATALVRAQASDDESSAEPAEAAQEGTSGDSESAASPPPATPEPVARVRPFGGFGFGTRSFERPTPIGGQRLPTAFFPALDVGMGVSVWPKASFSLEVLLRYQTSLGMRVEEQPPFALPNEVGARSQRAELSVAPTFSLGETDSGVALSIPVGMQIRTLWPDVHESMTPGYSLIGPHARLELLAQLVPQLFLRLGPELQWIIAIDRSLKQDGVLAQGIALGGEASLRFEIAWFALDLSYRESHAFASSNTVGPIFTDIERFLTARFMGTM